MTVKELVIQLLDCKMNKEIVLYDNLEYEDEIFGKTRGVTFPIENVVKSGIVLIEFDNSKKINKVLDGIRAEIKQAADKQFQIAMGVSDLNERYAHIQMENAYRHSLKIIDKCKAESEVHCNCTKEEIAKSFIEDVEAVKDLLPQESEDKE